MKRKVLFGYDYTDNELVKVLLYLMVGGSAALLEWGLFFILSTYILPDMGFAFVKSVLFGSAIAFGISTLYHYFLSNIFVFNSGSRYERGKEVSLVFLVSIIGLIFNLVLMYIFTDVLRWNPMASKVLSSCIVVVWNYLSRKKWVFRS